MSIAFVILPLIAKSDAFSFISGVKRTTLGNRGQLSYDNNMDHNHLNDEEMKTLHFSESLVLKLFGFAVDTRVSLASKLTTN